MATQEMATTDRDGLNTTQPVIQFQVPAAPVAQPRHRFGVVNGKARAFGARKSHPVHAFKAAVAKAATEAMGNGPLNGLAAIRIDFVLPRPTSMCWKAKPMPRVRQGGRPDCDNLAKGVTDALSGVLWRDDGQVNDLRVVKYTAGGDEQPHCVITVTRVDDLGAN